MQLSIHTTIPGTVYLTLEFRVK